MVVLAVAAWKLGHKRHPLKHGECYPYTTAGGKQLQSQSAIILFLPLAPPATSSFLPLTLLHTKVGPHERAMPAQAIAMTHALVMATSHASKTLGG